MGDKLREVFPKAIVGIRVVDAKANLLHFPYLNSEGKNWKVPSQPPAGLGAEVIRTGKTLLVNHDMDKVAAALGSTGNLVRGRKPKSAATG